jgi:hypothetical protein
MRLASPEWLILIPVFLLFGWYWKSLQLWRPLRLAALLLVVLVLVQPQLRRLGSGMDLWVLVDRSESAAEPLGPLLEEWGGLLDRSKSTQDRIIYVDFGENPVVRAEGDEVFRGGVHATRTASAIRFALARMARDRASRLLLLTDGYSTEPLEGIGERLVAEEVALDYRIAPELGQDDYRLASFDAPVRVQKGEPFLIELEVSGRPDGLVPFEILQDNALLARAQIEVKGGKGFARFAARLTKTGAFRFKARIIPPVDALAGNNQIERWVEVTGGERALLITQYANDPVAAVLEQQGFEVDVASDTGALDAGRLAGARAVILNNVPAYRVPADFLGAMDFYVRSQGGGFLMAGGKTSFGSGGYFQSAVDALLPVSMELRQEHRKLAVAMAIVLDRSGSMAVGVAGGPGGLSKMDLANEGAARGVELLGPHDAVAVFAVDSEPHPMVPLTMVGENRAKIGDAIRRITSGGGGIYVYTGLNAAWQELQKAELGQRHVILFADAADAEEPGNYKALLDEMTRAGATVSVIGLGTEADIDAAFLKDVALRGKGRIFFNANPADLPALFAQETVAVARSAFISDPVQTRPTAAWMEIAAKPIEWPEAVDGYNLSYLKPEAAGSLFTKDEYDAPLVAFWQRGIGRVAAVSFPLGGEYSQRVRSWPQYGDFVQTLSRWLMPDDLPPGIGLRTRMDGTQLSIDLLYDESWEQKFAQKPPGIVVSSGSSGAVSELVWERLEPGHFHASMDLQPGEWIRGAVQVGAGALPFGPVSTGANPEWAFDRGRIAELRAAAAISGGGERVDLAEIWKAPRKAGFSDLRGWLILLLLLVFLADAAVTRLGWKAPKIDKIPRVELPRIRRKKRAEAPESRPAVVVDSKPVEEPKRAGDEARRERFQSAKRRGL